MTKKELIAKHHRLWDEIIRIIARAVDNDIMKIKKCAWGAVFPDDHPLYAYCFGCAWDLHASKRGILRDCNKYCLFNVKNSAPADCLDGVYDILKMRLRRRQTKAAIKYATMIRNWPVRTK